MNWNWSVMLSLEELEKTSADGIGLLYGRADESEEEEE